MYTWYGNAETDFRRLDVIVRARKQMHVMPEPQTDEVKFNPDIIIDSDEDSHYASVRFSKPKEQPFDPIISLGPRPSSGERFSKFIDAKQQQGALQFIADQLAPQQKDGSWLYQRLVPRHMSGRLSMTA